MKNKIVFSLLLAALSLTAFAQDDDRKKPTGSDFTAEINLNPFASSPINISYLRFRYFTSDNLALRIGLGLSAEKETPGEDITRKTFEFNFRPGVEWHLTGTERLSPYLGIEADFATKTSSYEDTRENVYIRKIDGAWTENGSEQAFKRFGLNAIIGADFYVTKRVYVGTEFGFGFQTTQFDDIKLTYEDSSDTEKGGSDFELGVNFNSSIRLGFVF